MSSPNRYANAMKLQPRIQMPPHKHTRKAALVIFGFVLGSALALTLPPVPAFPAIGQEISLNTRSCQSSKVDGTPVTGHECSTWAQAGPINVVVLFKNRRPFDELVSKTDWTAASGNWLVLQGQTDEKYKGCGASWRDDTQQVQYRLDPTTRRHWKMIYEDCTQSDGSSVVFGQAHTDKYDVVKCGGDYAIDWDQARDSLVDAFRVLPNTDVQLLQVGKATKYPGGCKTWVNTDGYVAFITLYG
jgi:hypothetical protein